MFENGDDGIRSNGGEDGSTISGNSATANQGHGIKAGRGALVFENTLNDNRNCGLSLFVSAYRGGVTINSRTCVIEDTGSPHTAPASVNAGENVCGFSLFP